MNYLAHAYLSFNIPGLLVGNMISDFVKGKKQFDFPEEIQKGIRLHRQIDRYTDDHPVTKEARKFFSSSVGSYSGAFVDIVYDHFLALDQREMNEEQWLAFSKTTYAQLTEQRALLPEKFAEMLPYMKNQDWLYNYRFIWGIENSFRGLAGRAKYLSGPEQAFRDFTKHYEGLKLLYNDFFPSVKNFVMGQLES